MDRYIPADKTLFYCLIAFLVWIPLPLGSNRPWSSSLLIIFTALLLGGWCWLFLRGRVEVTPVFKKALPVLGLLVASNLWVGYQWISNHTLDAHATLHQWILGWSYIAVFALALLLINQRSRIKWVLYALVLSGTAQAIYGGVMTLGGTEYSFFIPKDSYTGVATGTFINRNHLAGYLVICLSLGLGLMIATLHTERSGSWRNRLRRWMMALLGEKARLRIALIIMVIGLVLTHSRMGNTSFFAAMMITGVIALLLSRRATRSTVILLGSLLVIDIFIVGTFFGVEKVMNRLENTSTQRETRDDVNRYSVKLLDEHLLTGTGAGTFYTAFPTYREADIRIFYDHAHNDYLEFLSERGLIGFIPLLLAAALSFAVAIKAQWKRRNALMRGVSFGCIMSMIAMSMHATVDFNLQIPSNAATFMLVLALAWIASYHSSRKTQPG